MKSEISILMLSLSMLLMGMGCQTANIPNVKFYAEIPFTDCPEGIYVESLTKKTGLISCKEWAKMRPYMIMVDPEGKKQIFNQWSEACRFAGKKKCNVHLNSVRDVVETIDKIAGQVIKE